MKHLDLFSGIGGFALATEMVWDDVEHVFCDNEPFSQAILKKHWPNSPIYGDIRTLTADSYIKRHLHPGTEEQPADGRHEAQREPLASPRSPALQFDLLTGGFPCQPFSNAGKRRGTDDDRYLWPEMLRVIREFHPRWIIAENVGGLVTWNNGLVLEQVCADLEGAGYEVQPFVIPAVAVNAPHRRDRIWFVAFNTEYARLDGSEDGESGAEGGDGNAAGSDELLEPTRPDLPWDDVADPQEQRGEQSWEARKRGSGFENGAWGEDWTQIAAELCRMDDGVSQRLDRTPRLKALGNAIVPQVAAEIMRAMKL